MMKVEELSDYLHKNWKSEMEEVFNFEASDWHADQNTNKKYQRIAPDVWKQMPEEDEGKIHVGFVHETTADALRNQVLTFHFRVPSHRNIHTTDYYENRTFNNIFPRCIREVENAILDSLDCGARCEIDTSFDGAGNMITATYDLSVKEGRVYDLYLRALKEAIKQFCMNSDLISVLNETFLEAYEKAFEGTPDKTQIEPLN